MQTERHSRIWKLQKKFAAIIAVAFLGITGLTGGISALQNHNQSTAVAQASTDAHFWRIIAGVEQRDSATDHVQQLAADLRSLMAEEANPATGLPDGVTNFRASASSYGALSGLSFNPFESNGALSPYVLEQLRLIKSDNLNQVVSTEETTTVQDTSGVSLAPFGMPLVAWAGIVYLTTTTAALTLAVRKDSKLYKYLPYELNWKTTGVGSADMYKRMSTILSPAYAFIVIPFNRMRGLDYDEVLAEMDLLNKHRSLKSLLKESKKLKPGDREEAELKIGQMLDLIDEQVARYANTDRTRYVDESKAVQERIDRTLGDIGDYLQIRTSIHKELDDQIGHLVEELGIEDAVDTNDHRGQTQTG